ncbi:hypothetical protein [Duganella lactea]|uniref:hypothetical protein n=1 Tax=Duganella lactea TaxID=2692173 RepID=UPI001926A289|nr:hypothetical protein [Duganella lactea]
MNVPMDTFIRSAHIDAIAISKFAEAMATRMHQAAMKGHAGWDDTERCTAATLQLELRQAVAKGDPVDVANYAMMLHARGERTRMPDAFNALFLENVAMRDALRAVLDEVSPGCTPISIHSSLPAGLIDLVRKAAEGGAL